MFGPAEKRTTVSEIHLCVEDHFSEWFPDLPTQKSYNHRPGRLSAVFAPLARKTLSEVGCEKTRNDIIRIADSMLIRVAKGQRASQAKVASDRLASVGYCSSKCVSYHGAGAPPCRRAQIRAASSSGAGWADARERKRSSRSPARFADNRRRGSLWRQGLLRRTFQGKARRRPRPRSADSGPRRKRAKRPFRRQISCFPRP